MAYSANPYQGTPYQTDWDRLLARNPGTTVGTPTITKTDPLALGESNLRSMSAGIGAEENRRYGQSVGTATDAYNSLRSTPLVDPNLLFSQAADSIGARSGANLEALRSSLGARGLNPNSGAASGMLQRLLFQQGNEVTGAIRDTALQNQKDRQTKAAQDFAAAMNLAGVQNSPVSQIGLDTEQNIYEGQLAKYGIDKQAKSAKKAGQNNVLGGLIGAAGSVLGGLL